MKTIILFIVSIWSSIITGQNNVVISTTTPSILEQQVASSSVSISVATTTNEQIKKVVEPIIENVVSQVIKQEEQNIGSVTEIVTEPVIETELVTKQVTEPVIDQIIEQVSNKVIEKSNNIILRNQFAVDGNNIYGKFKNLYIERKENGDYVRTLILFVVLGNDGQPIKANATVNDGMCQVWNNNNAKVLDDNNNYYKNKFVPIIQSECEFKEAGTYNLKIETDTGDILEQTVEVIESPYN